MKLDSKVPPGPLAEKWDKHKTSIKLVNPNNKRRFKIIIVGSGLAGASAAASLGELGYQVEVFTYHDSPRRAHSIAAQGGINAAKNYRNDGDSIFRLFYDTLKGGDYRAREGNVYRLAQVSVNIIDQAVAQGVPFAREYGGLLDTRSFGGAQVARTFYSAGQTGQQLLLGAYQQMMRQVNDGTRQAQHPQRDARPGGQGRTSGGDHHPRPRHGRDRPPHRPRGGAGDRRIFECVLPLHQRQGLQHLGDLAGSSPGRGLRQPLLHADPPDLHPPERRVPVEADADVGVVAQRRPDLGSQGSRPRSDGPNHIPEQDRDYFLERMYPAFGNLVPRDVASRAVKRMVDQGKGVGPRKNGVYLDFGDAINRLGRGSGRSSATPTSSRCTSGSPTRTPSRSRCGSIRRCTTRWAVSGSTTT